MIPFATSLVGGRRVWIGGEPDPCAYMSDKRHDIRVSHEVLVPPGHCAYRLFGGCDMPAPEGATLCLEHLEEAEVANGLERYRSQQVKLERDRERKRAIMADPELAEQYRKRKRVHDANQRQRRTEQMRKLRAENPEYHEQEKTRRRERDRKRRLEDPEWAEAERARKRVARSS